jgi:hypothetical protein
MDSQNGFSLSDLGKQILKKKKFKKVTSVALRDGP